MFYGPPFILPAPFMLVDGDSLAAGTDGTSIAIEAAKLQFGSQYRMQDVAVAATTTATMVSRYNTTVGPFAKAITGTKWNYSILGATNDPVNGLSAAQSLANLTTLISNSFTNGATGAILHTVPPAQTRDSAQNAIIATLNPTIRTLAASDSRIRLVDLEVLTPDASDRTIFLNDGTHYTALGQQVWAVAFNEALASL